MYLLSLERKGPHRPFRKWYAACYQAHQALHLPPTTYPKHNEDLKTVLVDLHLTTAILHYLFSPIPSEIEGRMESLKVAKFRGRLYFTLKSVRNSTEILKLKQDDFSPVPSYLSYKYTIIPETQYMKGCRHSNHPCRSALSYGPS